MSKLKIVVLVDLQVDFFTGALRNENAIKIIPRLKSKVQMVRNDPLVKKVYWTQDTHPSAERYLKTEEGKNLPVPHCEEYTEGWKIIPELREYILSIDTVIHKSGFGSDELARQITSYVDSLLIQGSIDSIDDIEVVLFGVCTDICVIANAIAIKTALPFIHVVVDERFCAGVTQESHDIAIQAMKNLQIQIVGHEKVVELNNEETV